MKNCKARVSVGMPVYNGERYLEEALESHLGQTYSEFELIISDNASTDRTEVICRSYAIRDSRIRYYRNTENIGLSRNFNRVFQLSSGEYFKWANADDLCKPDYLMRCIVELESHPAAVLTYARAQFIDETGTHLQIDDRGWDLRSKAAHDRLRYIILAGHWVNCLYGLIRASALAQTRLLPTYPHGDYRLLGELSLMGTFHEIPNYLFIRRLHPGSSSQNAANSRWMLKYFTGHSRSFRLPFWNLMLDHFTTIIRSDLPLHQKYSLILDLTRRMRWGRTQLLRELRVAAEVYFRGR